MEPCGTDESCCLSITWLGLAGNVDRLPASVVAGSMSLPEPCGGSSASEARQGGEYENRTDVRVFGINKLNRNS